MIESEIIRAMKKHFGSEVAREIRPSTVSNFKDLIILLETIEGKKIQKINENSNRERRVKPFRSPNTEI